MHDQFILHTGKLQPGETVLIHAGGSGVGTAAVQLASLAGATSIVTAGSEKKIATALDLGATQGFNYKEGDFASKVLEFTKGMYTNLHVSRFEDTDKVPFKFNF